MSGGSVATRPMKRLAAAAGGVAVVGADEARDGAWNLRGPVGARPVVEGAQEVVEPVEAPEPLPAEPKVGDAEDVVLVRADEALDPLGADLRILTGGDNRLGVEPRRACGG